MDDPAWTELQIAEIPLSDSQRVMVKHLARDGNDLYDVRKFWKSKNQKDFCMSKKGICLQPSVWKQVFTKLQEVGLPL